MAHLRRQVRDAFGQALAGLSFGGNVFRGRSWPLHDANYPAALIYARGGASSYDAAAASNGLSPLTRDERVVVEIALKAGGDDAAAVCLDDEIDDLAAEVEAAVMASVAIGALVDHLELVGTEVDAAVGGDARRGSCRLIYCVMFRTQAGDPSVRV